MQKSTAKDIDTNKKATLKKLLDPKFDEIKKLLANNSLSKVADSLNESYNLDVNREDVVNYLYNIRTDFDVQSYRKELHTFDIKSARNEDANKQFHPRFR